MDENEMPKPNSHKYHKEQVEKEQRKKPTKVISGTAIEKKESLGKRVKDSIISEDAPNVISYVAAEVLVPAFKETLSDAFKTFIDTLFFGQRRSGSYRKSQINYVNYDQMRSRYDYGRREVYPNTYDRRRNSVYDFKDYILPTREDAQVVLEELDDYLDEYGIVSVGDLYSLLGEEPMHLDNKYGWTNLAGATFRRDRDGWGLVLPRPKPID